MSNPSRLVFVVDDEQIITSTLTLILKHCGYDARGFVSPLEALEASRLDEPSLVITDLQMTELSGIDLAVRLKQQHPACTVMLFSGQLQADYINQHGYDFHILPKPVQPAVLLARVKEIMDPA